MSGAIYEPLPTPRTRQIRSSYGLLLLLLACLVLGLWVATQYVAHRFGFHRDLGPAWLILPPGSAMHLRAGSVLAAGVALSLVPFSGPRRLALPFLLLAGITFSISFCPAIYAPQHFVQWAILLRGLEETSPYFDLFNEGLLFGGIAFLSAVLCILVLRKTDRVLTLSGSHGTASWGDGRELMTEEGLLIGRKHVGKKKSKLLRYSGEGHLITVAPTRSGKGVGSVIPNLLTYEGSVVVTDPKGENYAVTARRRREALGHTTLALDPFDQLSAFGLPCSEAAFNPMDLIDPVGSDILESASLLADMLVVPTGSRGEELFWAEEAKALLSGLILYVAATETDGFGEPTEQRNLMRVREHLTLPKEDFADLMERMKGSTLAGGLVARSAARLLQKEDKERSGVISTAQSHTHFLDSPRMTRVMRRSTFDLSQIKREKISIYLILPAHYLDTYSRWLRLMIASTLHEIARSPGIPERRILFLLDEFANLGRMNPVLRAVSLLAGYGAQIWIFLQDLSQLRGTYPEKWGTFLANADVLQAFGTNDHDTARYLSDLTGESTIFVETENQSLSRSRGKYASRSRANSQSYAEKSRKLMLPDEVRRMSRAEQVLFVKGGASIRAVKLNYLQDSEFFIHEKPIFDRNPMYALLQRTVARSG